jgi:POT family proton-dependent oligopeptide transporter
MSTPNDDAGKMEKLMAYTDGYYQLAIYALICGVVLILISSLMKKLMHGVK